jgi:lysophospholipase L1-like esterase
MRNRRLVLVFALCALVLVAWAPPDDSPGGAKKKPKHLPPPDTYVALGDSFVAGPLIPVQDTGPTAGCLRSSNNYPNMVAPQTGLPVFKDVSCSGAETEDMTQPQGVTPGPNPPQFDALGLTTGLVTVGIGGNDIGFSDVATTCGEAFLTGGSCQNSFDPPLSQRIAETGPKVDAVLDGIRQRAPQARIVVVNYLPIFPEGPLVPGAPEGCPPFMPISPSDVPFLRGVQKELNQMLADQATANGATYVDAYAAGIGHDACQPPGIRWVEPAIFIPWAAPVHPNIQGMQGVANEVVAAIA